jgi:hypothetical protein
MIHEGFVNHSDLMTNDQFPMTNGGTRTRRAVSGLLLAIADWALVIPAVIRDGVREQSGLVDRIAAPPARQEGAACA